MSIPLNKSCKQHLINVKLSKICVALVNIISVSLKSRNNVNLPLLGYLNRQNDYCLNYELCVCDGDIRANIKIFEGDDL